MRYGRQHVGGLVVFRDKQGHPVVGVGWRFRRVPEGVDLSEWLKRYKRITWGCHIVVAVALATSLRGGDFLAFAVVGLLTVLGPILWVRSVTQEWVPVPSSEIAVESYLLHPRAVQKVVQWRERVLTRLRRSQPPGARF